MSQAVTSATSRSIAPATGVGSVHLAVTDGERAERFYEDVVGLRRLEPAGGATRLGAGGKELVVLHPGASGPVVPHRTGLYHLAIVVPTRRDLALAIYRLMQFDFPNYPTDHVLTKADYLWDPDGNGIEIYTETPEDGTWFFDERAGFGARDRDGRSRSGRDPIDLQQLFSQLQPGDSTAQPLPAGTKMGHVHLHVSHLQDAVDFYHGLIGFDVTGVAPRFGMAFVSAGGYHHHVGLNTWAGEGVEPAPQGTAGLKHFTVELPAEGDLEPVLGRLARAGVDVESRDGTHVARDPSQNVVHLRVRPD